MKRKVTMLALLIATMAPTATEAKNLIPAKHWNYKSLIQEEDFSISAVGEGIVQVGHHHSIGITVTEAQGNFLNSVDDTFEVSFMLGSESTADGIVKIDGIAVSPGAFYEFDSAEMIFEFQGLTEGLANLNLQVRNSAGQIQTISLEIGVKSDATTWNGSAWSNGIPSAEKHAIINGIYSGTGFVAKSLQVNREASMVIEESGTLTIDGSITNFGALISEDKSSIIQLDDDAVNVGEINYKRRTAPVRRYDFTYWGSPVTGETLYDLSPLTLWDKYYSWNAETQSWLTHVSGEEVMQAGKGYIVRAPQSYSLTDAEVYDAEFKGVPNNGILTIEVKGNSENEKLNLLSNPYPSALDADLFMNHPDNVGVLGGTILLWSHTTSPSSSIPGESQINYSSDDYAKYNATGGIKTASLQNGGVTPNGKIASGQGFFITASSDSEIVFNNSMRVSDNSQFFRMANMTTSTQSVQERHRVWLKASNVGGAYDETLIGFIENATDGIDRSFDGRYTSSEKAINIYSFINNEKFSIQGKAIPAEVGNQIINLGYKSTIAGVFTIDIEGIDGFFTDANRPVYLDDSVTNISHNLKNGAYDFSTAIGTFDNRFRLRIPFNTLGTETPEIVENDLKIFTSAGVLRIESASEITALSVYDISGRLVISRKNINETQVTTQVENLSKGIYIVKCKLKENTVTKKIKL